MRAIRMIKQCQLDIVWPILHINSLPAIGCKWKQQSSCRLSCSQELRQIANDAEVVALFSRMWDQCYYRGVTFQTNCHCIMRESEARLCMIPLSGFSYLPTVHCHHGKKKRQTRHEVWNPYFRPHVIFTILNILRVLSRTAHQTLQ